MRLVFTPTVLGLCAGLALVAASLPSPAYAARDICVKILQPVKSAVAVKPAPSLAGGRARQSEVWTVEVGIGDCVPPPPPQGGPAPSSWPPLSFDAALDVSSGGTAICAATTRLSAGGPMPKVFRFKLVYPPRDPGQSPASVTTQAAPIPYMIRATAQVADGTPANNQGTATFRFFPGGTASCLPWHQ